MTHSRRKLTDAQKAFVVHRLAAYESPDDVAAEVLELFGITLTRPAVAHYDPTTYAGRTLSPRWVELFHAKRARIIASALRDLDGGASAPQFRRGVTPEDIRAALAEPEPEVTDEQRLRAILALIDKVAAEKEDFDEDPDFKGLRDIDRSKFSDYGTMLEASLAARDARRKADAMADAGDAREESTNA